MKDGLVAFISVLLVVCGMGYRGLQNKENQMEKLQLTYGHESAVR